MISCCVCVCAVVPRRHSSGVGQRRGNFSMKKANILGFLPFCSFRTLWGFVFQHRLVFYALASVSLHTDPFTHPLQGRSSFQVLKRLLCKRNFARVDLPKRTIAWCQCCCCALWTSGQGGGGQQGNWVRGAKSQHLKQVEK